MTDDTMSIRNLSKAASELSKLLAQVEFETGRTAYVRKLAQCKLLASAIADHIGEHSAACKATKQEDDDGN